MSTTITVSTAAELNQALSQATGGETILLSAGNYGDLSLYGNQFASTVTIKSADPGAMASFSTIKLNQASNITFDSINFDYTYSSGDYYFQRPFAVDNSSNIAFTNSIFDGDYAGGAGTGVGLGIKSSNNVTVTNSEIKGWWKGVIATNSDGVDVVSTNIHSIRSDGLVFDNVDNILVDKNYFHDFGAKAGANDHRDMIQVQRANGSGSDNITIRNNIFDMGNGDHTQTIWMGGDGKNTSDPNVMHHNVLIQGNTIYNGHFHGISIDGADGLTITQNSVLHLDVTSLTGGIEIPVINVTSGSKNVTIDYNIASQVRGYTGQSDWNVSNNALIQPGEYDQNFTYQATAQADGYTQYVVKPGSLAATLGAGSLYTTSPPGTSMDLLTNNTVTPNPSTGTSQPSVNPTPPTPGTNQPGADQPTTGTDQPGTGGEQPETGGEQPETGGEREPVAVSGNPIDISDRDDRGNIGVLEEYVDSEQVFICIDLARDGDNSGAERLVWNPSNFGLKINKKGDLIANVDNNDGGFRDGFKIKNLDLNDGEAHQISLMVDQDADQLQISVDGEVVLNETETDFDFVGGRERGWIIGDSVEGLAVDTAVDFTEAPIEHYYDLFA